MWVYLFTLDTKYQGFLRASNYTHYGQDIFWRLEVLSYSLRTSLVKAEVALCLWCYSCISRIIQDYSIFHIYILYPKYQNITQISISDLPYQFVYLLNISALSDLCINGFPTIVKAKYKCNVYHHWISVGCRFPILNGYSFSAWNLISSCWSKHYLLLVRCFIPDEMMCRQYQTTMTSHNMQYYIGGRLVSNHRYIGALSTKWTSTNQFMFWPHSVGLAKQNRGFIYPEWGKVLSIQYMATQLSYR